MVKKIFVILVILFPHAGLAVEKDISGRWICHMSSEYAEYDFSLDVGSDGSYTKKWTQFGSQYIDHGEWGVEGKKLILKRTRSIKNDSQKDSNQIFERDIVSIGASSLQLSHGESIETACEK